MATNWNFTLFIHFFVWVLLCVISCGAESSGDASLRQIQDADVTTEQITTLISELTSLEETSETDESTTARENVTAFTNQSNSTTLSSAKTTIEQWSSTTSTLTTSTLRTSTTGSTKSILIGGLTTSNGVPVKEPSYEEDTELLARLNGYKIATFCLAVILVIVLLIILIYFSTKSKTGHGEITHPPNTPPLGMEDFERDEEPKVVRLSSYFPYADSTLSKKEHIDLNGARAVDIDDDDDDADDHRKVTSFLKRKKSVEDTAGSQDKILHTSDL